MYTISSDNNNWLGAIKNVIIIVQINFLLWKNLVVLSTIILLSHLTSRYRLPQEELQTAEIIVLFMAPYIFNYTVKTGFFKKVQK
jgi:hypothetical protein